MSRSLSLESFENVLSNDAAPNPEFNEGYEAGLAAGAAAAQAETEALNAAVVQAIADIDFTYAEARGQVLSALTPLFTTIAERILPHCVSTGFATELAAMLVEAAEADTSAEMMLHVHPDQQAAIEAAIQNIATSVTVTADPALSVHAVWIKSGRQETLLDIDVLLQRINEILGAIQTTENRIDSYG